MENKYAELAAEIRAARQTFSLLNYLEELAALAVNHEPEKLLTILAALDLAARMQPEPNQERRELNRYLQQQAPPSEMHGIYDVKDQFLADAEAKHPDEDEHGLESEDIAGETLDEGDIPGTEDE